MKYHQKDIVEIDFPIPGEGYKVHPALIVSNDDLQVDEGFVYVALISSQAFTYSQHYAYELKDEMLTFKMEKQSYVKCGCWKNVIHVCLNQMSPFPAGAGVIHDCPPAFVSRGIPAY